MGISDSDLLNWWTLRFFPLFKHSSSAVFLNSELMAYTQRDWYVLAKTKIETTSAFVEYPQLGLGSLREQ